jgi:hypothetical protein
LAGRDVLTNQEKERVRQATTIAMTEFGVLQAAGTLSTAATVIAPRDRRAAAAHLRRAAAVPPAEIAAAAALILEGNPGLTEAELASSIHALLGLDAGARVAVAARLAALVGAGTVRPAG